MSTCFSAVFLGVFFLLFFIVRFCFAICFLLPIFYCVFLLCFCFLMVFTMFFVSNLQLLWDLDAGIEECVCLSNTHLKICFGFLGDRGSQKFDDRELETQEPNESTSKCSIYNRFEQIIELSTARKGCACKSKRCGRRCSLQTP